MRSNMRFFFLTSVFFIISLTAKAQDFPDSSQNWKDFADLSYELTEDEYGEIYVPKFGSKPKKMEGKRISIKGYIIPFQGMFEPNHIIISSLPIASCFFCGGSGAETVAEAELLEPIKYTQKLVEVTGTLKLNDNDYDRLMYILIDAKVKIL